MGCIASRQTIQEACEQVSGGLGVLQSAVSANAISPARVVQIMEEMVFAGACFSEELIEVFRTSILKN
jgi:predicted nucleic acid-binding protein